jgi:hypothetical protein
VSRSGEACPHNLRARRSEPKNGLPQFLAAFSRLLPCRHGGATGVLFRAHGLPRRCLPERRLNWDCWLCLFGLSCAISSTTVYLLHYLSRTATVWSTVGERHTGLTGRPRPLADLWGELVGAGRASLRTLIPPNFSVHVYLVLLATLIQIPVVVCSCHSAI